MLKSFKTEINPTEEQIIKIQKTIGTCRFIYNFYLSHNKMRHQNQEPFLTGKDFSLWLNREFLPANPDYGWIKEVSSKSVKQSMEHACQAFQRFFKGQAGFPQFKKKGKSDPKMYFVKNNPSDCLCERHRIKIPTLGWVRLKEKGYIPVAKDGYTVRSGVVFVQAGRYYVSVLACLPDQKPVKQTENPGIGIDLGIKEFAILSDGRVYPNINKTETVKKLEKRLKRAQKYLSRKYKNKKKGEAAPCKNIEKQKWKVQKLYQKLANIRTDYNNKVIAEIVKTKPSYITLEDLNVSGMRKNKHLSKMIASQKFYEFRSRLTAKAKEQGIEVRIVNRWYPSSKRCHSCGKRKSGLKLSDRTFVCTCGYQADRDLNASLNLRDAESYTVA